MLKTINNPNMKAEFEPSFPGNIVKALRLN